MGGDRKGSALVSVITEVVIAGVLVALILGTLNYFAILPLSQTFPALSFLPTQSGSVQQPQSQQRVTRSQTNNNTISLLSLAVVTADKPQKFTNSAKEPLYKYVEKSLVTARGVLRVDLEVAVNNSASASGIAFNNGKKFGEKDYKSLQIVRYVKDKPVWLLVEKSGDNSKYTYLSNSALGRDFRKFSLMVTADGKTVIVMTPGTPSKTIQLADSFFAAGKQIHASVSVAPNSELDLYSLYYQY